MKATSGNKFDEKSFQELLKKDIYSIAAKINPSDEQYNVTSSVVSVNALKKVQSPSNNFFEQSDLDDSKLFVSENVETNFECYPYMHDNIKRK